MSFGVDDTHIYEYVNISRKNAKPKEMHTNHVPSMDVSYLWLNQIPVGNYPK